MKKIICILLSLLITGASSFAQIKDTKTTKPAPAKQAKTTPDKAKPGSEGGQAGKKLKKDGTPDMRHKENKTAANPAPKLKKDGTPDMRYKQNKDAVSKNAVQKK